MIRHVVLTVFVLAALTPVAHAIPTITLPDFVLQPDLAGQVITLEVEGGDPISNLLLSVEIGNGTAGPLITSFDFVTSTIFSGHAPGAVEYGDSLPTRTFGLSITTNDLPAADGVIVRLALDTTGILGGPGPDQAFEFRLTNTPLNPSDTYWGLDDEFNLFLGNFVYTHPEAERPYSLLIIQGSPVPEPGSIALGLFALAALALVAHRRHRTRRVP